MTNPPIDPIREEVVMSLQTPVRGPALQPRACPRHVRDTAACAL